MRLVDEITEQRPVARRLPAPTGQPVSTDLRAPGAASPATVAPAMIVPTLPRLPPVAPKAPAPATGQVPTPMAAAQLFHASLATMSPAAKPKPKRRKLRIAAAVLVGVVATLAVVFRDSAAVERFTGKGYDTNPLPTQAFTRPVFAGADYTFTVQMVSARDGLPNNYWRTEHDEVDYTAKLAKLTTTYAKASIIGGTIGTPMQISPAAHELVDEQSTYEEGATADDPWVRSPLQVGSWQQGVLGTSDIPMYQDLVDPTLRAQHPTSVVSEVRHEIAVTTYHYTFTLGSLYESAPRLFERFKGIDGIAADDAPVTVTISFDDQMMVRFLDIEVDYKSVVEHRVKQDSEGFFSYHTTLEVLSTTATPPAVELPAHVVDSTTTTSTTTTTIAAPVTP